MGYDVDTHLLLKRRLSGFDDIYFYRSFSLVVKSSRCWAFPRCYIDIIDARRDSLFFRIEMRIRMISIQPTETFLNTCFPPRSEAVLQSKISNPGFPDPNHKSPKHSTEVMLCQKNLYQLFLPFNSLQYPHELSVSLLGKLSPLQISIVISGFVR